MGRTLGVALVLAALAVVLLPGLGCGSGGSNGGGGNGNGDPVPQVDANYQPSAFLGSFPIGNVDCGQTFVVETTGQLTEVQLHLSGGAMGMMTVDVRMTVGAQNGPTDDDSMALGSATIDVGTISPTRSYVSFDLTASNIQVTQGDILAIVARRISGDATVGSIWAATADGGYTSGSAWRRIGGQGNPWNLQANDFGFVTYVLPATP